MTSRSGKRKSHRKTKSGCKTCKARHLKCDRTWPACENCTSSWRTCDGYDVRPSANVTGYHMSLEYFRETFCPTPVLSIGHFGTRSSKELRSLEYFQSRTVAMLSGFFASNVWSSQPFHISQTEPVILLAIIALSAHHEGLEEFGLEGCYFHQLSKRNSTSTYYFALEQYTKAIVLFRSDLSTDEVSPAGVGLGCVLFACIEFLRGDRESALIHISGALSFINSRRQKFSRLSKEEEDLIPLLSRLSLTQSLYGRPRRSQFPNLLDIYTTNPTTQLEHFCSLDEARAANTSLLNSILRFVRRAEQDYFPDDLTKAEMQCSLRSQLESWYTAFDAFFNSSSTEIADSRGPCLLRVHYLMAVTFLIGSKTREESAYDLAISNFEAIVTSLESIFSQAANDKSLCSATYSLDTGVIAPLFYTAIKCRDYAVRSRAIALLHCVPRYEGLWDAIEVAKAAKIVMEFEHQDTEDEKLSESALVSERRRVHDVDICRRESFSASKQRVILRWKPDGIDQKVQEVHKYIFW